MTDGRRYRIGESARRAAQVLLRPEYSRTLLRAKYDPTRCYVRGTARRDGGCARRRALVALACRSSALARIHDRAEVFLDAGFGLRGVCNRVAASSAGSALG
jgi:hypothetical protein